MIPTRILVAEGDAVVARDLSRVLERFGYQVPAVLRPGDDAIRAARESSADLALLDIGLLDGSPGWTEGESLSRELRIPIVYLTSAGTLGARDRGLPADSYGYILKPVREEELHSVVELALQRHRLENRLARERRHFAAALGAVGDAVIATDTQGRVTFANAAAERLTGRGSEGMVGRPAADLLRVVHRETGMRLPDPLAQALHLGEARPFDRAAALAVAGRRVPLRGAISPVTGDDGELLGAIVTCAEEREGEAAGGPSFEPAPRPGSARRAVTGAVRRSPDARKRNPISSDRPDVDVPSDGERHRASSDRERQGAAADEERYSRMFRTSPLPMTLTSLEDGRVIEVNEAFGQLSGWQPEEALGASLVDLGWWTCPRDGVWLDETVRSDSHAEDVEMTFSTRSGEIRETLVSAERMEIGGEDCLLTVIHDITERKELERELQRHALHDPLTGLPNRTLFHDRLDHALDRVQRRGTHVAVLFMDLDGFKEVNDGLGHTRGDGLLRAVAERVRGCVRDGDTLARYGGDEFAAVLEPIEHRREIERVAERFIEALARPVEFEDLRIPVAASIGIAIGGPGRACPEELVRAADMAMYRAKEERGTSFRFFDPSIAGLRRDPGFRRRPAT